MVPGLPRLPEGTFLFLGRHDLFLFIQMSLSDLSLQEFLKLELRHVLPFRQGSPSHRGPSRYLVKLLLLAPGLHAYGE